MALPRTAGHKSSSRDAPPAAIGATRSSALRIGLRRQLVGPRAADAVARVLQVLFWPPLLIPALAAVAAGHVWFYASVGAVRAPFAEIAARPGLLLAVLAVLLLASAVHELGHAAGLRYGGGRTRGIGMGIYLVFPAFYTDVTDGYRLGRWARIRTDLGGVWFHALFAAGVIALYASTGHPALLLVVVLIDIDIVRQFMPFIRLDGYWVLADLTGVPDPLAHGAASIRSFIDRRRFGPGTAAPVPQLRPAARIALVLHLSLAFLALPLMLGLAALHLPTISRLLWASLQVHVDALAGSLADGELVAALADAVRVGVLAIQLLSIGWLLYAVVFRPARAAWRWLRRAGAARPGPGRSELDDDRRTLAVKSPPQADGSAHGAPGAEGPLPTSGSPRPST